MYQTLVVLLFTLLPLSAPAQGLVSSLPHPVSRALEIRIAESTFELSYVSGGRRPLRMGATGFLVGPNLLITNRHVIESLAGANPHILSPSVLNQKVQHLTLTRLPVSKVLHPASLEICLKDLDICILRLPAPSEEDTFPRTPLPLKSDLSSLTPGSWIGLIGNMHCQGLQAASAHPVSTTPQGALLHCIPTSAMNAGGNSGSPIFDEDGNVVAVDAYSVMLDSGCALREKTTGIGIAAPAILEALARERPDLARELKSAN